MGDIDAITATGEPQRLLDRDPLSVGPGQRHDEFVGAAEIEFHRIGRVHGIVICFRPVAGRIQPGLDQAEVGPPGAQELHEDVGLIFRNRVIQQLGALQRAPLRADCHVEHIGPDPYGFFCRVLRRRLDTIQGRCVICQARRIHGLGWQRRQARFLGRRDGLLSCRRLRRGLRPVVLQPRLVGQPEHQAEGCPDEEPLVVHLRLARPVAVWSSAAAPFPVRFQAVEQRPVTRPACRRLIDDDDVQAAKRFLLSEGFADDALQPVPAGTQPAVLFPDGESQSGLVGAVRRK